VNQKLRLPGPFFVRFVVWIALLFISPLPSGIIGYSFRGEVLGQVVAFPASADGAALTEEQPEVSFSDRLVARLLKAETHEPDAWFRDDYRIARVTVGLARKDSPIPHIEATYCVLGLHPDNVWPAIIARRKAQLGSMYLDFYDENDLWRVEDLSLLTLPAKKAVQSERLFLARKIA
jgi:hypothetical protein